MRDPRVGEFYYLVGWEVPNDVPLANIQSNWPDTVIGRCNGRTENSTLWIGAVFAPKGWQAWTLVIDAYGFSKARIKQRFEPKLRIGTQLRADLRSKL